MSRFPDGKSCMETLQDTVKEAYLQRRGRDVTLECSALRLLLALERLGQYVPNAAPTITYFEASPSKNEECYKRWQELNDAGAFLRRMLAARKASEATSEAKP